MANSLRLGLTLERYAGGHLVAIPAVTVQLRRDGRVGHKLPGLLDTGAGFTLARIQTAAQLGLDVATVKTSADRTNLAGARWQRERTRMGLGDGSGPWRG